MTSIAFSLALPVCLLVSTLLAQCQPEPGKLLFPVTIGCDSQRLAGITVSAMTSSATGTADVFKLAPVKADANRAQVIGRLLGLSSIAVESVVPEDRRMLTINDPKGDLSISEDTGKVEFESLLPASTGPTAISLQEAERRARRLLAQVQLLPQAELAANVEMQGDLIWVTLVDAHNPPADMRDGQYIEALLYPSGQLKHLTYFWRERQDTGSYPLISSSEAQERLSRCDAVILRTLGPDNVVDNDLRQVRLAYMRTPGADGDYLMPTFVFQSDTMRGDFPSTVAIVPALADKFVAWVAPDRSAHMP